MLYRLFISNLIFLFIALLSNAQTLTQTVRGLVLDKNVQSPVVGAAIELLEAKPTNIAITKADGSFILSNVKIGRQSLRIRYLGYKEYQLTNIVVNAGKELVLSIDLEEDITQLSEVTIRPTTEKDKPLNDMAAVSARTFSVEETQKFAAALNDPARMATGFAGVAATSETSNEISIRGNSPNGLLWRLEGVDIPTPSHFSSLGAAGGGISLLSAQLLANSDFMTSAFPAEYGNALSGVFDLKLRKGNNRKREYTVQLGFLGIDASAEGPFSQNYEGAYLVNYRYSTLGLITKLGIDLIGANQQFQDLSYNISLPTQRFGKFTIFGISGLSSSESEAKKDSLEWKKDHSTQNNERFGSNTGAWGTTHSYNLSKNMFLKTAIVYAVYQNEFLNQQYNKKYVFIPLTKEEYLLKKLTLNSTLNYKINQKAWLRSGIICTNHGYELLRGRYQEVLKGLDITLDSDGQTQTVQAYSQLNYKYSQALTLNVGLHYFRLNLNQKQSIEPRISLKYEIDENQSFSFGYGLHSQLLPLALYFYKTTVNKATVFPNKEIDFSKAHHIVIGYDRRINDHTRLKLETYYQKLFNVPVRADVKNAFSIVNITDGFVFNAVKNAGYGHNMGVEATFERFLHQNFYYLLSASLFSSKYAGSDNVERNTRFNAGRALNVLAGKEWTMGSSQNNVLGLNLKLNYMGGFRTTPIDLQNSIKNRATVLVKNADFEEQLPDYFRADLRLSWKRNKPQFTTTLSIDIQNVMNRRNISGISFNPVTNQLKNTYQLPLIPILNYRLEF